MAQDPVATGPKPEQASGVRLWGHDLTPPCMACQPGMQLLLQAGHEGGFEDAGQPFLPPGYPVPTQATLRG